MQQVHVPGLGNLLKGWRKRRKKAQAVWADGIFNAGFNRWGSNTTTCNPTSLARGLDAIENSDQWVLGDFCTEAMPFCVACKTAFVQSPYDAVEFRAIAYLCACYVLRYCGYVVRPP